LHFVLFSKIIGNLKTSRILYLGLELTLLDLKNRIHFLRQSL
jgi:hypothetical protein